MLPGPCRLRWWLPFAVAAFGGAASPRAAGLEATGAPLAEWPGARGRRLGSPGRGREGPAALAAPPRSLSQAAAEPAEAPDAAGPAAEGAASSLEGPDVGSQNHGGGKDKWVRAGFLLFLLFAAVGAMAALFFWIFQRQALLGRTATDVLEDERVDMSRDIAESVIFTARADGERTTDADLTRSGRLTDRSGDDEERTTDSDDDFLLSKSVSVVGRLGQLQRGNSGGLLPRDDDTPDGQLKHVKGDMVASREIRYWVRLAKSTKLDIYTCLGLANGTNPLGPETKAFVPAILLLIVMQGVLPVLLLFIETKGGMYTVEQDPLFRLIGFILYLYSILVLYEGAFDPCRTLFLDMALQYNVSYSYIVPMVFGECMNTLTAFFLARTLYLIFIDSHRPLELLIKCIAINFVIVIDNEWTTEHMRHKALRDFEMFQAHLMEEQGRHKSFKDSRGFAYYLQVALKYFMCVSRVVGILIVGVACAFLFLFANQDDWCRRLGNDMWPVCIPSNGAHQPAGPQH